MKLIENTKILPTITTISNNLWRKKIEEVKKLKLKEVFVFFNCIR